MNKILPRWIESDITLLEHIFSLRLWLWVRLSFWTPSSQTDLESMLVPPSIYVTISNLIVRMKGIWFAIILLVTRSKKQMHNDKQLCIRLYTILMAETWFIGVGGGGEKGAGVGMLFFGDGSQFYRVHVKKNSMGKNVFLKKFPCVKM